MGRPPPRRSGRPAASEEDGGAASGGGREWGQPVRPVKARRAEGPSPDPSRLRGRREGRRVGTASLRSGRWQGRRGEREGGGWGGLLYLSSPACGGGREGGWRPRVPSRPAALRAPPPTPPASGRGEGRGGRHYSSSPACGGGREGGWRPRVPSRPAALRAPPPTLPASGKRRVGRPPYIPPPPLAGEAGRGPAAVRRGKARRVEGPPPTPPAGGRGEGWGGLCSGGRRGGRGEREGGWRGGLLYLSFSACGGGREGRALRLTGWATPLWSSG